MSDNYDTYQPIECRSTINYNGWKRISSTSRCWMSYYILDNLLKIEINKEKIPFAL